MVVLVLEISGVARLLWKEMEILRLDQVLEISRDPLLASSREMEMLEISRDPLLASSREMEILTLLIFWRQEIWWPVAGDPPIFSI